MLRTSEIERRPFHAWVCAAIAVSVSIFAAASVEAQRVIVNPAAEPLLRDRDPLLPDAFNPSKALIFTTRDPAFTRFLGRVSAVVEKTPPVEVRPEGVEVIDGRDADRDGYVEYYDGSAYIAELKKQGPLEGDTDVLRFTGTIRQTHVTTYEGYSEQHLLLRIAHDGGKQALVDAGKAAALSKLDLEPGDMVTVTARLGLVNDTPALIAHQLTHDGATVKILRDQTDR